MFNPKEATQKMQEYMNSYSNQHYYDKYTEETFVKDVLYGLGLAVWGNSWADGYKETLKNLKKYIEDQESYPPSSAD